MLLENAAEYRGDMARTIDQMPTGVKASAQARSRPSLASLALDIQRRQERQVYALTPGARAVHDSCVPDKKVIAFLGSPRPRGNTDTLAEAVLEGARSAGCAAESYALRALSIHHCTGCGNCGKKGRLCIFRDDGEMLYDAMTAADVFLFVTPVYWYGPTSIMKTFLDRLVVFNIPEARPRVRGKPAGLVAAWEEKGMEAVEPMVKLFDMGFRYLELRDAGKLLIDGAGPKDAVRTMSGALDRARAFGKALA